MKIYNILKNILGYGAKYIFNNKKYEINKAENIIKEETINEEENINEQDKIDKYIEEYINVVPENKKNNEFEETVEKNSLFTEERLKIKFVSKYKTSIIILTYNKLNYTKLCIDSIRKYTDKDTYEIIVVDNNSCDGTGRWLRKQADIKTIFNKENLGFPKGCNQGIRIASGNNILLLNNDVIVTPKWLDNLIKCLYSLEDIGAVGAVTNYCANYQAIPKQYNNLKALIKFTEKFNISNPLKWEERLKLIGYCFLTKREVINKIGLLDEIFTPGMYEDDDYSLRIRQAGYKLMLCKDTFIHHFGNSSFKQNFSIFYNAASINRIKFEKKWGINPEKFTFIRKEIASIIKESNISNINVMHIGCGGGGTLLHIKNQIEEANLYGIESNSKAVVNTEHFAKIEIGGIEEIKNCNEKFFDYIIIDISCKDIKEYIDILLSISAYLKEAGSFIVVVPNKLDNKIDLLKKYINTSLGYLKFKVYRNKEYILLMLK